MRVAAGLHKGHFMAGTQTNTALQADTYLACTTSGPEDVTMGTQVSQSSLLSIFHSRSLPMDYTGY
jgi:hypothetical protein